MTKTILPLLAICLLLLSGCATPSTAIKLDKNRDYYFGLMSLVLETNEDFKQLDSITYENHIRGKFNNLVSSTYRNEVEKALGNKFSFDNAQIRLVKSSEVFEINKDVSYSQFLQKMKDTGVDGILFVNKYNISQVQNYDTRHYQHSSSSSVVGTEEKARFNSYIIDVETLKPVWYTDTHVQSESAYIMNKQLAESVFKKLRKDKYILTRNY
ncbi:hypothetical protein [Pontibacter mucosus]|nr:hypothetical protein [Pontibacter mucosus]